MRISSPSRLLLLSGLLSHQGEGVQTAGPRQDAPIAFPAASERSDPDPAAPGPPIADRPGLLPAARKGRRVRSRTFCISLENPQLTSWLRARFGCSAGRGIVRAGAGGAVCQRTSRRRYHRCGRRVRSPNPGDETPHTNRTIDQASATPKPRTIIATGRRPCGASSAQAWKGNAEMADGSGLAGSSPDKPPRSHEKRGGGAGSAAARG
jgi:hypothetical protein